MTSRKKGTPPADPALEAATSLLNFGSELYTEYQRSPSLPLYQSPLPITRHGDYLHHFGFSLEREVAYPAGLKTIYHPVEAAATHLGGGAEREGTDVQRGSNPFAPLSQGMAAELQEAADQHSRDVGPLKDVESLPELARLLTAPFSAVTWRQNELQCTLKKIRCIYRWLCDNLHLIGDGLPEEIEAEAAAAPKKGAAAAAAKAKPPAANKKKQPKAARTSDSANTPAAPPDPLLLALRRRSATSQVMATLFNTLLTSIGIPCEEVDGRLKGLAPEESVEWRWNLVTVHDRQHIVDVAASHAEAFLLRKHTAQLDLAEDGAPAPTAGATRGAAAVAAAPPSASSKGAGPENAGSTAASTPATQGTASEYVNAGPSLAPFVSTGTNDFYFFASPDAFIGTHYPAIEEKSLLKVVPKRVQWDVMPRLTHDFFAYDLQLLSHPRHAAFTVRSAPFYISLQNNTPATTELCCAVFNGSLPQMEDRLDLSKPLGGQWVWHQREETTGAETFTLTVPQAGHYTVVIGARPIRSHPYTPEITAVQQYTPVVFYQAKVIFVPLGTAILPQQILSPAICRLITPLTSQLLPGSHHFAIMPSCSNVVAAVVVSCTAQSDGAATTPVLPKRSCLSFLTFDGERAAFEGDVVLKVGDSVEVWILYAAPDRNGVQLGQRMSAAAETPLPPVVVSPAPSSSHKRSGSAKKKKGTPAPPPQAELIYQMLLEKRRAGASFQPFVMGIQVRRFASSELAKVVQPQPTVEMERVATLRRLAGVTSDLAVEAAAVKQLRPAVVGNYFGLLR